MTETPQELIELLIEDLRNSSFVLSCEWEEGFVPPDRTPAETIRQLLKDAERKPKLD